jgi:hypothetical protein
MEDASQDGATLESCWGLMAFVTKPARKQQAPPAPDMDGTPHRAGEVATFCCGLRARTMSALPRARCDFRTENSTPARRGCFCTMNVQCEEIVYDLGLV